MKKKLALVLMAMATMLALVGTALAADTTYHTVVEVEDWGATITKVIVDLGQQTSGTVDKDTFTVYVTRSDDRLDNPVIESGYRRVTDAYLSNETGTKAVSGRYVTIEMAYGPSITLSSALNYNGRNAWIDCDYVITQQKAIGSINGLVANEESGRTRVGIDDFTLGSGTYDGTDFVYASYDPQTSGKHPLIIWFHGGGEGASATTPADATIPLAANKAVALAGENIQSRFEGGAYVLVPQSPTSWPNSRTENLTTSTYAAGIMELIEDFVSKNDVDTDRIYVGGCSAGGAMTMIMMREYPTYFTAAYPICPAITNSTVTDDQIDIWKDQNIWLTVSATDTTLNPLRYVMPIYTRIREAGSKNVHLTFFDSVVDTSGLYRQENDEPHEYDGHWSWTYVYNDVVNARIEGETVNLWDWIAAQSK